MRSGILNVYSYEAGEFFLGGGAVYLSPTYQIHAVNICQYQAVSWSSWRQDLPYQGEMGQQPEAPTVATVTAIFAGRSSRRKRWTLIEKERKWKNVRIF